MWSVRVTCNAKGNVWYRARTTTATIGLVVSGYLVMSGTTAGPAVGQGSSEGAKGGWSTQVQPTARVDAAENQSEKQYIGASSKEKTADSGASTNNKGDGQDDLFL